MNVPNISTNEHAIEIPDTSDEEEVIIIEPFVESVDLTVEDNYKCVIKKIGNHAWQTKMFNGSEKKIFRQCNLCPLNQFDSLSDFKKHLHNHPTKSKYTCELCPNRKKKFRSRLARLQHVQCKHPGILKEKSKSCKAKRRDARKLTTIQAIGEIIKTVRTQQTDETRNQNICENSTFEQNNATISLDINLVQQSICENNCKDTNNVLFIPNNEETNGFNSYKNNASTENQNLEIQSNEIINTNNSQITEVQNDIEIEITENVDIQDDHSKSINNCLNNNSIEHNLEIERNFPIVNGTDLNKSNTHFLNLTTDLNDENNKKIDNNEEQPKAALGNEEVQKAGNGEPIFQLSDSNICSDEIQIIEPTILTVDLTIENDLQPTRENVRSTRIIPVIRRQNDPFVYTPPILEGKWCDDIPSFPKISCYFWPFE